MLACLTSCRELSDKGMAKKDSAETSYSGSQGSGWQDSVSIEMPADKCIFADPDTSLGNIKLRDYESAGAILRNADVLDSNDRYHFYSSSGKEILTLTQHAGDGRYQISIFKVERAEPGDYPYRKLNMENFVTEKGIQLGISKSDIVEKLGRCYRVRDSAKNSIVLYYKLESPRESRTGLLARSNMPVYYASYKLVDGLLQEFEFGFEYP